MVICYRCVKYDANECQYLKLEMFFFSQILEILKQFELKKYQSFGVDWDRFLKRTAWILKDLERESTNPPCFLLATVYINICCNVKDTNEM